MWDMILNHIYEVSGGIVLLLLTAVYTVLRRWVKKHISMGDFTAVHRIVHQKLAEMRVQTEADRAYVIQFRNGQKFDTNTPMFRLYMTHEVLLGGTAPASELWNRQGVMASSIYELLDVLCNRREDTEYSTHFPAAAFANPTETMYGEKKRCVQLVHVAKLQEGYLKSFLITQDIWMVAVSPLIRNGEIVGYVGADFRSDRYRDGNNIPNHLEKLMHTASLISFELTRTGG